MNLKDKRVIVTGGTRGLGLGLVELLVAHSAKVTVVARGAEGLESVHARFGVDTISADVTDETAAHRIVSEVRPDILVLNAGAEPRMGRLDQLSWADFTTTWETDVKAGLYWLQAALKTPLKSGSRVLVGSSGAAQNGSPLSGGYAGAKRTQMFLADYAQKESARLQLGLQFLALTPGRIMPETELGKAAIEAYASSLGLSPADFIKNMGAKLTTEDVANAVVTLASDSRERAGKTFLVSASGIELLS